MECNSMNLFLLLKLVNEKAGTDKGKYLSEIWLKEIKNPPNEDKFYLKKCSQHIATSMNSAAGPSFIQKTSKWPFSDW